jgi:hypothetical protein
VGDIWRGLREAVENGVPLSRDPAAFFERLRSEGRAVVASSQLARGLVAGQGFRLTQRFFPKEITAAPDLYD